MKDLESENRELRAVSEGRLKVLNEKAEEAKREWVRAESAEKKCDDLKAQLAAEKRMTEQLATMIHEAKRLPMISDTINALVKSEERVRELEVIGKMLLHAFVPRRRVHVGNGPVSGQIGREEFDSYEAALSRAPEQGQAAPSELKPEHSCEELDCKVVRPPSTAGKEWWCERCQMVLDGIHVTSDGKHDASNCGYPVQWREKFKGQENGQGEGA